MSLNLASIKAEVGSDELPSMDNPKDKKGKSSSSNKTKRSGSKKKRRPSSLDFDGNVVFRLKNFGMTINVKKWCGDKKKLTILKNVNAIVHGREMMAIMGPSGSGKTSLLESAALNYPSTATITGKVTLNKMPLTAGVFRDHCYIVNQNDYLASIFTCRETLLFAAKNCITSEKRMTNTIDELIESLGLKECEHVRVGDERNPGLSGGQKRRLSVCLALLKGPRCLFLDEPTSGLDTVSALKTCQKIHEIAVRHNLAVIITIHQPSTKIYDTFDKLMLLYKGEVMYFGPSDAAEDFFAKLGHKLPPRTNIADYVLDVLEDESFDIEKFRMEQSNSVHLRQDHLNLSNLVIAKLVRKPRPSVLNQTLTNVYREAIRIKRDPLLYTARCVAFFGLSVFFAVVYIKSAERTQDQALSRVWFMLWLLAIPGNNACILIFGHSIDVLNLKRNVHNGIFHPTSFFVAKLLQLPMMLMFAISAITVGGYFIGNWQPDRYVIIVLLNALSYTSMEFTAELCAVISSQAPIGILAFLGYWFANFLFGGMLTQDKDVVWPLKVICYILPFRYAMRPIIYMEFIDSIWKGTSPCTEGTDKMCHPGGYKCSPDVVCYGRTGAEVLNTMGKQFAIISSVNKTGECILFLILYCVGIKVLYIIRIMWIIKQK